MRKDGLHMENKRSFNDLVQEAMGKVKEMVDVNTIVGEPIATPDGVTLIPISKASFAFGGGGVDFSGKVKDPTNFGGSSGGVGVGVKVEPVAFLVIKEGFVRVLPVAMPPASTIDRVVEMVPDLVDKVAELLPKKEKEETF